jgi:hypothetical protein
LKSLNIFGFLNFCKVEFPVYWNVTSALVDSLHSFNSATNDTNVKNTKNAENENSLSHEQTLTLIEKLSDYSILNRKISDNKENKNQQHGNMISTNNESFLIDETELSTYFFWLTVIEKCVDIFDYSLLQSHLIPILFR